MEEVVFLIVAVLVLSFVFYYPCKKRAEITRRCPKCGSTCNASPWSTGVRYVGGGYLHNFTCPNCGHKFMV